MITKEAFKALVRSAPNRPNRLPRPTLPVAQERAYRKRLSRYLDAMRSAVDLAAVQALPDNVSRLALDAKDAGDIIDQARKQLSARWTKTRLDALVRPIAKEVDRIQTSSLNRQLRTFASVDVVGAEPWLARASDEWVSENVSLIKTVSSRYFDQLETLIQKETADGARWEDLSEKIAERFNVSEANADRIARDQVGKFYGDLNRVRQVDLGISRFRWRTQNDNRVRDEHDALNGEVFSWSDLPAEGAPGEPILCRCYADPVIEDLLE